MSRPRQGATRRFHCGEVTCLAENVRVSVGEERWRGCGKSAEGAIGASFWSGRLDRGGGGTIILTPPDEGLAGPGCCR